MQKMLALMLASLLVIPSGASAQPAHSRSSAGPLLAAALAEAENWREAETQVPDDSWNQLQSLPVGTKIRVTLMDGVEIEGQLVEAQTDAVVLEANQLLKGQYRSAAGTAIRDKRTFPRATIVRLGIPQPQKGFVARHPVLMGAAVGGALGGLIATGSCREDLDYPCSAGRAIGVGFFTGVGALIGLIAR